MKRIMEKPATTLADRIADRALVLIATINMLFLVLFLLTAWLAMPAMAASDSAQTCNGSDLLAALKADDPPAYAALEAEARATPNGEGLLWRIQKDGVEPSFLFGTMHLTDPRVLTLPPAAKTAYDGASTVVIETTDVLDPAKASASVLAHPELMMFTDQTTLSGLLSDEDRAIVEAALKERGVPFASVQKMKPWMLIAMVALPQCETARKNAGAEILDVKLARDAQASEKQVLGLETMADQLGAMASLPIDFHIQGLVDTIRLGDDGLEDVFETMIVLYEQGETGMVWPMFRAVMPEQSMDGEGYAEFEEALVNARNITMADHAGPILAEGDAFIAVGALHLPGEKGLVEILRQRGYTVTAVN